MYFGNSLAYMFVYKSSMDARIKTEKLSQIKSNLYMANKVIHLQYKTFEESIFQLPEGDN